MELSKEFKKIAAAGLAAVTMSGAAMADELGSNARYVDEGPQATATAQQFPWSKDPRYVDQMQRAERVFETNKHKLEVNHENGLTKCATNSITAGGRQANRAAVANRAHKGNNPLAEIGLITGAVTIGANNLQCKANVEANFEKSKAQLETSFLRQEDAINKSFAQQYKQQHKTSRFVGTQQQKTPQSFDEKKQQACEQAELNAIKTGRDMNAVQKKMCTDVLKR